MIPEADERGSVGALHNTVLPNFFDALVHPDVILPLVLSHLLSDSLWLRRERVIEHLGELTSPDPSIPIDLYAIQRFIDRNFEHVHPSFVGELFGMTSIDDEAQRLGDVAVRRGLDRVLESVAYRESMGQTSVAWMRDVISEGSFPNYCYSTYDVIRAHRRFAKHRKGAFGILSCLDEMALFCAAALTLPRDRLYDVILLAGAPHYTVMLWDADRNGYWFPAKSTLYSRAMWHRHVDENFAGDAQAAYASQLSETNRIISVRGAFDVDTSTTQLPLEILHDTLRLIEDFFGFVPKDLATALTSPPTVEPSLPYVDVFEALRGVETVETVRQQVYAAALTHRDTWAWHVLLAYRSFEAITLAPFMEAARRGLLARDLAEPWTDPQQAVAYVESIAGRESMFANRDRIALPDETIRMQTGSDRDRALLLFVLVEHVLRRDSTMHDVRVMFTSAESVVAWANNIYNTTTMCYQSEYPTHIVCSLPNQDANHG